MTHPWRRGVALIAAAGLSLSQSSHTPALPLPRLLRSLPPTGNSLTVMVACLAPTDAAYEENMSTLDYAARAKRVTNHVRTLGAACTRALPRCSVAVHFVFFFLHFLSLLESCL